MPPARASATVKTMAESSLGSIKAAARRLYGLGRGLVLRLLPLPRWCLETQMLRQAAGERGRDATRMMPFGSHLDDVGFLCSGTLARYRSGWHDVAIAVMTRGDVGSPSLNPDRIAGIREKEARASAVRFVRETPRALYLVQAGPPQARSCSPHPIAARIWPWTNRQTTCV